MLVPDFWAEARLQERTPQGKQITVRRFGWSVSNQSDADAMAMQRAAEALATIASGTPLFRREPKVPYNGADGVPIREEVLSRHGDSVITRNSYGAHCLNTPDCLIADIDFELQPSAGLRVRTWFLLALLSLLLGFLQGVAILVVSLLLSFVAAWPVASFIHRMTVHLRGGHLAIATQRVREFIDLHGGWGTRMYRTPAGLRVIVTHRAFSSSDHEVREFFQAVRVDPYYAVMCTNQKCFRARLTAKPWRVGIASHMRPRPGVWPVSPDAMPRRSQWVAAYEKAAQPFAACRYIGSHGNSSIALTVEAVVALHDTESKALIQEIAIA